jgi:hypothetical protein
MLRAAFAVRLADIYAQQLRAEEAEEQVAHAAASLDAAEEPDQAAAALLLALAELVRGELAQQQGELADACQLSAAAARRLEAALQPGGMAHSADVPAVGAGEHVKAKVRRRQAKGSAAGTAGSAQGSGQGMQWQLRAALAQARLQIADSQARLGQWEEAASSCEEATQACAGSSQPPEQAFPLQMAAVHCCRVRILEASSSSVAADEQCRATGSSQGARHCTEGAAAATRGKQREAASGTASSEGSEEGRLLQQLHLLLQAHALCSEVPALYRCAWLSAWHVLASHVALWLHAATASLMLACSAVASSLAEVCRRLGLPWAAVAFLHASLGGAVRVQYAAVVESRVQSLQRRCSQATGWL